MANLKNLKNFKKGQSGNPLGGKLHNPEIKKLKALTQAELVEVGTLVVKGQMSKLREMIKDPTTPALQAMVAGLAVKTIAKGDPAAFNALMDRILGKVKENVHLSGTLSNTTKITHLKTPDNNRAKKPDDNTPT